MSRMGNSIGKKKILNSKCHNCIIIAPAIFLIMMELRFEFTEDIEHEVFALNKDYQIIWKNTFGSGIAPSGTTMPELLTALILHISIPVFSAQMLERSVDT